MSVLLKKLNSEIMQGQLEIKLYHVSIFGKIAFSVIIYTIK